MKKLSLVLFLTISLFLLGCGNSSKDNQDQSTYSGDNLTGSVIETGENLTGIEVINQIDLDTTTINQYYTYLSGKNFDKAFESRTGDKVSLVGLTNLYKDIKNISASGIHVVGTGAYNFTVSYAGYCTNEKYDVVKQVIDGKILDVSSKKTFSYNGTGENKIQYNNDFLCFRGKKLLTVAPQQVRFDVALGSRFSTPPMQLKNDEGREFTFNVDDNQLFFDDDFGIQWMIQIPSTMYPKTVAGGKKLSVFIKNLIQSLEIKKYSNSEYVKLLQTQYPGFDIEKAKQKTTYTTTNGKEVINQNFQRDAKYVYLGYKDILKGMDPKTAFAIGTRYIKDTKNVFYLTEKVIGADPTTFKAFNDKYGNDKNNVYCKGKKLDKADTQTFVGFSGGDQVPFRGKDKNNVYGEFCEIIPGIDSASFTFTTENGTTIGKDKNNVFCGIFSQGGDINGRILKGADPKTFQIIKPPYARDTNNIFNYKICEIIVGANPNSFEVVNSFFSVSKDDKNIYVDNYSANETFYRVNSMGDKPIRLGDIIDTKSFVSIGNRYFKDNGHVYYISHGLIHPIMGADSSSFVVGIKMKAGSPYEYEYDAKDNSNKYLEGNMIK